MWIRSPSPGAPSISSVHRRVEDWLGCASAGPNQDRDMNKEELSLHINILEMKEVQIALIAFKDWIIESVVFMSNNATVLAYIKKQEILARAEQFAIFLTAWYILGKNIFPYQLIRSDQVLLTEWSLLPRMFDVICKKYRHPLINLCLKNKNETVAERVSCPRYQWLERWTPSDTIETISESMPSICLLI